MAVLTSLALLVDVLVTKSTTLRSTRCSCLDNWCSTDFRIDPTARQLNPRPRFDLVVRTDKGTRQSLVDTAVRTQRDCDRDGRDLRSPQGLETSIFPALSSDNTLKQPVIVQSSSEITFHFHLWLSLFPRWYIRFSFDTVISISIINSSGHSTCYRTSLKLEIQLELALRATRSTCSHSSPTPTTNPTFPRNN